MSGPSLGEVARIKVLGVPGRNEADASIGHPLFFPGEKVVERAETKVTLHGEHEKMFITVTSMPDITGAHNAGRILLSYDRAVTVCYGGIFFARSYGRTCVQSIYLVEEYRRSDLGALLAQLAKSRRMTCVFEPVSPAGAAWAKRHGLKVRKG